MRDCAMDLLSDVGKWNFDSFRQAWLVVKIRLYLSLIMFAIIFFFFQFPVLIESINCNVNDLTKFNITTDYRMSHV